MGPNITIIAGGGVLPEGPRGLDDPIPGEIGRGYGGASVVIDLRCGGQIRLAWQGGREYAAFGVRPRAAALESALLAATTPYGAPPRPVWWSQGTQDPSCPCPLCASAALHAEAEG